MVDENIRKVLSSLAPNRRYAVRVRAISRLGVSSDWSEVLEFRTPLDPTSPEAPTNLIADFSSPDLILRWDPTTTNVDGSPIVDLSGYRVTLTGNSITKDFDVATPFFVMGFNQNEAIYNKAASFTVSIVAVDVSGNESAALTGTATNAVPGIPPAPAGTSTTSATMLELSPNSADEDINRYIVQRSATSGSGFVQIANTSADIITIDNTTDMLVGETYYYRFRTRDVFGQLSPFSPELALTVTESPPMKGFPNSSGKAAGLIIRTDGNGKWNFVGHDLDELDDVDLSATPPSGGNALVYDAVSSLWKPGEVSVAQDLDDLTDVDVSATPPSDAQALVYEQSSGLWKPGTVATESGASTLDDLTDVDTAATPPSDQTTLVYDAGSSLWKPGQPNKTKGFVNHGADPNVARPTGYTSVEWYGSIEPVNALATDTWIDTDEEIEQGSGNASGYSTTVGDGTSTSFTVTHNLATAAVIVQIYDVTDGWNLVTADVAVASDNSITVGFSAAPTSNQYRVNVLGIPGVTFA